MKFFKTNSKGSKLPTLDEKDIQKKLYGTYHKGNWSSNRDSGGQEASQSIAKAVRVTAPIDEQRSGVNWQYVKDSSRRVFQWIVEMAKVIPWKYVGIAIAAFLAAIIMIQLISFGLEKVENLFNRAPSKVSETIKPIMPSIERKAEAVVGERVQQNVEQPNPSDAFDSVVVLSEPNDASAQRGGNSGVSTSNSIGNVDSAAGIKLKHYVVQVCTYQREKDAKNLLQRLNDHRFSGFYQKSMSTQSRTPYYVVYLNRNETYQAAKDQLAQFQNSSLESDFSDAFIRSL